MIFSVPETNGLQSTSLRLLVREACNPCNENMNCDLEVSLPWDPFIPLRNELSRSKSLMLSELEFSYKYLMGMCLPDNDLKKICMENIAGKCY